MNRKIDIAHDGKTYEWDGKGWYDTKTFQSPPKHVVRQLEKKAEGNLPLDVKGLLQRASEAKSRNDDYEAYRCAKLVLIACAPLSAPTSEEAFAEMRRRNTIYPGRNDCYGPAVAAIVCSSLRSMGRPGDAIKETEQYADSDYKALRASRAGAFCDLCEWEKAIEVIAPIEGKAAEKVRERIKNNKKWDKVIEKKAINEFRKRSGVLH